MDFVKLTLSPYGSYSYVDASNTEMTHLGFFFTSDVGCSKEDSPTYAEWAFQDRWGRGFCGNAIRVEKEGDWVFLSDIFSEEEIPTELKMSRQQFVDIIDDWFNKVCKRKPKEVTITYDGNQFTIETSDV